MMKSYLSLIPISAKIHNRQNRMTIICIILSVFLVTAIFSMADMGIRMEKVRAINNHGNWHIALKDIPENKMELIGSRPDVVASSQYYVFNYAIDKEYYINNKKAAFCGVDKDFITDIMNCFAEGAYPQNEKEIMLTDNAKNIFGINIGDNISVKTPYGNIDYIVSGFCKSTSLIMQYDAIGVIMNMTAFNKIYDVNNNEISNPVYYVRFDEHINIRKTIADIKEQYGFTDENISENTALLGITGFSSNSYMMGLYLVAAVLFVLILTAGVLMIAGSINTNVAERSQFFGMLRCIGASRKQIIRFVRLEALNWCKVAIPIGVILGIIITWILCAILRFGINGEFSYIPVFEVSAIGIISGIIVGILTVLIAAQAPAKRASKVSPAAAVSGSVWNTKNVHCSANTRFFKIETALGIHHAVSSKKNLILMTCSFALSIILFLSFSVVLDFTRHALNPLKPYYPDLSIISKDRSCSVDRDLIDKIKDKPYIERVFGRMFSSNIAVISDKNIDVIDLISFEEYQLNWAKEDIVDGDLSKIYGNSNYVLAIYDKNSPLSIGDKLQLNGTEIEISGILSTSQFALDGTSTIVCSEETFMRLTGESDYAVIDIQLKNNATDEDANIIRNLAGDEYILSDRRESNKEITGTYWAFILLVYGFLAIITMITVFNIMNSISMSVSARIKQYGTMRAIGMSISQVTKMITAEAVTYAAIGSLIGCILGLPIHKFLFKNMITDYWGDIWSIPFLPMTIIIWLSVTSSIAAVYKPSKRIRDMSVIDTIHTQ